MNGKVLETQNFTGNTIALNRLSSGMYFLRLETGGQPVHTHKIVVTP
jgi:hypothetical protein